MDVGDLLAKDAPKSPSADEVRPTSRQRSTRHALTSQTILQHNQMFASPADSPTRASPTKQQKHITFELLLPEGDNRENRARLPMRVMISPHDTTDSIITTVRNFYGLYEGPGVSFQDREGRILIATFENFEHDMVVYVRMTAPDPAITAANNSVRARSITTSPRKPKLGAPIDIRPPSRNASQYPSRPSSRAAHAAHAAHAVHAVHARSISPQSNRSMSAKPRSRNGYNSKDNSAHDHDDSDSDGAQSRRSKIEAHASAEISLDNIVEGGRRKRAKFDSSELPLFVPPQVPAANSISSISPQRRPPGSGEPMASPFSWNQRTFAYNQQPLPSPLSYTGHYSSNVHTPYNPTSQFRDRNNNPPPPFQPRSSVGGGILPTPEPTNASVISDEDVALQLMRLGDASNFSHGRTSTSTLDDALSGKADAASSVEESDDEHGELLAAARLHGSVSGPTPGPGPGPTSHAAGPRRKKQCTLDVAIPGTGTSTESAHSSGDDYDDGSFSDVPEYDVNGAHIPHALSKNKALPNSRSRGSVSSVNGSIKSSKSRLPGPVKSRPKSNSTTKVPMSPASLPSQSRKTSAASTINFQHQLGVDEEDLSTKPRCQRCRKSKKGCDRQRPCGRCKDAGIGIEGCLSEDEGNGRKGRYGRHMGVPVKKEGLTMDDYYDSVPVTSIGGGGNGGGTGEFLAPALPDKNKKRKR